MEGTEDLLNMAVAAGLGLLVGLQREWSAEHAPIGGVRTFAVIGLLGGAGGLLGPVAAGVALLGVIAFFVVGNLARRSAEHAEQGVTTEVASIAVFLAGALATGGQLTLAVFSGGIVATLLHFKPELHGVIDRMKDKDLRGVIQLALIGLVILPALPDETYGPYDVLNPFDIWRMVVLIVGISLAAYASYRMVGARSGSVLGGLLGGLISSTATTVSYARQVHSTPSTARLAALVILLASTVVNVRVLAEIGAVAPGFLPVAAPPIAAVLGLMVVLCLVLGWFARGERELELDHDNPAQLKAALTFGAMYAVVLFVVAAVKEHFGDEGLYVVAVISGLTDVDAITLSTAEMVTEERVSADTGWRVVLVAAAANLFFKAGASVVLGGKQLAVPILVTFGISIAGSLAVVFLWP